MPVSYGEATDECSSIERTSAQGLKYSHQAAICQVAICFRPILGDKSADGVQTRSLTNQPTSGLMTIDLSRFVDNTELNKCE